VLTGVSHWARLPAERGSQVEYANSFSCLPAGLPFRPIRKTLRPTIPGTQTAVVVGPPGEEIFTDKYGRVKVQFHWDRQGQNDANSSCWVRVGALNAGLEAGPTLVPRVGDEVIVVFLEGDPDQPIIVGSVFNGIHLPPTAPISE
jgi:type VI secretion system secreted protein VgrG